MDNQTATPVDTVAHINASDAESLIPLGAYGAPALPQEIQDMVIDGNADDIRTLLKTSMVNRACRMKTVEHLFLRIVVRAVSRSNIQPAIEEMNNLPEIPDEDIPIRTFNEAMDTVPHYVDQHVQTLVLRGASLSIRLENATRGVRLAKPTLSAHDIRDFLRRFPNIKSIVIEDVRWVECSEQQEDCECMQTMKKRAYDILAFRRVTHESYTFENALVVTQSASSIGNLIVESCDREESVKPRYPVAQVPAFTLGIKTNQWEHGPLVPQFEPHTLITLNVTDMSTLDIPLIRDIIEDHHKSLKEASFRAWLFDGDPEQWTALGLDQCTTLETIKIFISVDFGSIKRILGRQAMLTHILAQLPTSVESVYLVFDLYLAKFAEGSCLLSRRCWHMVAAACVLLPRLTELKIHIRLVRGMKPISSKKMYALQQFLEGILRDANGNPIRFEITYGVQTPITVDYEPDLEEAYDEGLEARDRDY